MRDSMKLYRNAIWKALLISILFIVASIAVGLTWETNDDPAIAFLLSRQDNDYSPFQWRFLSIILHNLYIYLPVIDWWAVCNVFAIWCCAFACTYVICRRYLHGNAVLCICITLAFLWYVALYRLNFTRTAIAVSIGGCILAADSTFEKNFGVRCCVEYIIGCILLLFGASIRNQCALIALGFLAVIGATRLLSDHFSFNLKWFRLHGRQIVMLCMTALIYFIALGIHSQILSPEQVQYERYNHLRSAIQDYSSRFPAFEEAAEQYNAAGLDYNAHDMFWNWFSEDTAIFTTEVLENVGELATQRPSLSGLQSVYDQNRFITAIAAIFLILISHRKRENWLRNIIVVGAAVLCYLYLILSGRLPSRVYLSVMLAAIYAAVFLSGEDTLEVKHIVSPKTKGKYEPTVPVVHRVAPPLIIAYVVILCLFLGNVAKLISADISADNLASKEKQIQHNREILDKIDADKEHIYMFDIYASPASVNSAFSFWEIRPEHYCENRFDLGGWDPRHPYSVNLLDEYGITNPVKALFERTDVYSMYSARLLHYLRIHYTLGIAVSQTGELDGIPLVQYASVIDDALLTADSDTTVCIEEFQYNSDIAEGAWYFSAEVSMNEETPATEDRLFYCNITIGDIRYTYRLGFEDNVIYGNLYGMGPDFDITNADFKVFEKMPDGQYLAYNLATSVG